MNQETKTIEYTLNTIGRQVNEEYPELTLHFMLYKREGTVIKNVGNSARLPNHPAAGKMQTYLKNYTPKTIDFTGISIDQQRQFPFLKYKETYLAVYQIDIDALEEETTLTFPNAPDKYQRITGYGLAWRALNLLRKYKKQEVDFNPQKEDILRPKHNLVLELRKNLLSECFAAMYMEQQGENGVIQQLMKRRCEMCIEKNTGFSPELYPFPIAIDATKVIHQDLKNTATDKHNIIRHTMNMTDEIDLICDDITLKQWMEFCYNAQQMTWNERTRHEILSAATYSSEDAYMRTTAYIVAEALNTDVTPLNNPQFYNPYADQEKFERLHIKTAKRIFKDLFTQAQQEKKPEIMLEFALQQNQRLLTGDIIGWCAPALIKTCNAYSKEDIRTSLLEDVFTQALEDTHWKDICDLGRFIMLKKRSNTPITTSLIINEYIRGRGQLETFKEAFTAT